MEKKKGPFNDVGMTWRIHIPDGDIALQEAIRILDGKASCPSIKELYARSEKWHPYSSIAAHLLWGYYTGIKQNVIVMPQGVPPIVKLPAGGIKKSANAKERVKD